MNKLADDHQARRDAAMLASRASNYNGGIRTPDDALNAGDGNVVAYSTETEPMREQG